MLINIDPVIFSIGPLEVRWYGLMYVLGFLLGSALMKRLILSGYAKLTVTQIDTLVTYLIIGMIIGARLFYVGIYGLEYHLANPLEIFAVWQGGLSFHGALVGLLAGGYIFAKRNKIPMLNLMDSVALAGAPGLFLGRVGNFINGELYGRVTDVPWGCIFVGGGPYPRHPSQLYEAITEGLLLTIFLWFVHKKIKFSGGVFALFVGGYGVFRFIIEFFREPDSQMGYYLKYFSMGQILCVLMVIASVLLWIFFKRRDHRSNV